MSTHAQQFSSPGEIRAPLYLSRAYRVDRTVSSERGNHPVIKTEPTLSEIKKRARQVGVCAEASVKVPGGDCKIGRLGPGASIYDVDGNVRHVVNQRAISPVLGAIELLLNFEGRKTKLRTLHGTCLAFSHWLFGNLFGSSSVMFPAWKLPFFRLSPFLQRTDGAFVTLILNEPAVVSVNGLPVYFGSPLRLLAASRNGVVQPSDFVTPQLTKTEGCALALSPKMLSRRQVSSIGSTLMLKHLGVTE